MSLSNEVQPTRFCWRKWFCLVIAGCTICVPATIAASQAEFQNTTARYKSDDFDD